jgi:hypothetical protein
MEYSPTSLAFTIIYSNSDPVYKKLSNTFRRISLTLTKVFIRILYNPPNHIRRNFSQPFDYYSRKLFVIEYMDVGSYNINNGTDIYTFGVNFKYKSCVSYIT